MVSVDERLEGIKMRLRHSMNKFHVKSDDDADIEVARAFERPNVSYLNRWAFTVRISHLFSAPYEGHWS
jgi:RNA-dependent RNA polymerase